MVLSRYGKWDIWRYHSIKSVDSAVGTCFNKSCSKFGIHKRRWCAYFENFSEYGISKRRWSVFVLLVFMEDAKTSTPIYHF